jgi:hypothetical protein
MGKEIEITPAMIEAGADVLASWLPEAASHGYFR